MIKLIIHCADIHIHNFVRLDEYSEQFDRFINKCEEITNDYEYDEARILISGDLVHSKNNISNELISVASLLIRRLEEIAPVVIIGGNHDMLMENTSRIDTLTGLFNTAVFERATYLDKTLDYKSGCVVDDNVIWALYSIFDDYMRPDIEDAKEENPNAKVIGLYHGMIIGATLNNGSVVDEGLDGDAFDGCDCVMAGHIHKRQELKRGDVKIIYPGSLIQQTFGETVSQHGFTIWNIEDMTYKHIDLDTEYGLYDIEIDSIDDINENKERLINF